jgi:HEAT repeat protein
VQLDDDLTRWEYWWEFNKDPYIRLKEAIHSNTVVSGGDEFFLGATRKVDARDSLKPTDEDKLNVILPALKKAIDSTDQRDINSSCMVAMAKIGKDFMDGGTKVHLREVFAPRLQRGDQEIRESAALSLGIAGIPDDDNVDLLVGLVTDNELGRKVSAQPEVNDRTRAFAAYGLGLVAWWNASTDLKAKAFAALRQVVDNDNIVNRNIKVAVVNAVGLLNINTVDDKGKALAAEALKCLEDYYMKPLGAGEQLLQAHAPTAIAKLLGKNFHDPKVVDHYKKLFADDLTQKGKVKRASDHIYQSCALALGQLCSPCEDEKAADAGYCKLLLDTWHDHKDAQTRYYSILAIGQIGGLLNRATLLKEFDKAGKSLEKPWVAMGMGVYSFAKFEAERAAGKTPVPDEAFGSSLRAAIEDVSNLNAQSAFAVALGLCKYNNAADDLRALLVKNASKDDFAGYLCIGLALMNDTGAKEDIRNIVQKSIRRPDLLKQAAISLGKLGDKSVADELQKLLADGEQNLAKLSAVASALGFIGDRRTIEPLRKMLFDEQLTELSRAFAAVALGGVGDKEPLPWNSKIGVNMNYRAAVETLTDRQAGILDIL